MPINNLPASLQSAIQTGYLERAFEDSLRARLGFRALAEREDFAAGIGESITKTRPALLPAITTPLPPASNSDITSGLTPQNYGVEQYSLSVNQYAGNLMLNTATSRVAIASVFLKNAANLGEQSQRSVDMLAQQAIFNAYMGGNTRVRVTLGAAGTAVAVDDIRGFQNTWTANGQVVPVSSANPVNVQVAGNLYSMTGAAADGTNVSTTPGGVSGVLTFSSAVSVADGTAANAVVSAVAPIIMRPSLTSNGLMAATSAAISAANNVNAGKLTMQMILQAKAAMSANGVAPAAGANGLFVLYADPIHLTGLYMDPAFQQFFRGKPDSSEYRRGVVAELLGVRIEETNLNPVQNLAGVGTVRRAILGGDGALVEGVFTREGYAGVNEASPEDEAITIVDDIAHIVREPIDALQQVVTQSWSYIGGFAVPTDLNTNPTTIPTANNSALKRAIILESL